MKAIALFSLLLLVLTGCQDKLEPGTTEQNGGLVIALPLVTLQASKEQTTEQFVGSVESRDRAVLVARSSGKVTKLNVREGAVTTEGQVLLEISDNTAGEQLRAAEASIRAAERQVESAQARLTLAEQTAERYRKLLDSAAITAQEFDQVTADLSMARQQLAASQAQVERGEAERDSILKQNSYNRLVAPFPGTVVSIHVELGATVLPGIQLLTLDREGVRQARIKVPERLLGQISPGAEMKISVPALGREVVGQVIRVQGASDPTSRSFDVLVDLSKADGLPTGVFVRASRNLPGEALVLIPKTAVTQRGQLTGVFLIIDDVMKFRLVRLGRDFGNQVEVLSGLKAGDEIVAEQVEQAKNGARVERGS